MLSPRAQAKALRDEGFPFISGGHSKEQQDWGFALIDAACRLDSRLYEEPLPHRLVTVAIAA